MDTNRSSQASAPCSAAATPPAALAVGAVSFLNARPLIEGLDAAADVRLIREVPSRLAELLAAKRLDAALLPVIDLQRLPIPPRILPAGCISSDGPTLTVRIFSQVAPAEIRRLWADTDSHTSVVLAQTLWAEQYGRSLLVHPYRAGRADPPAEAEAVLLIGDKVVTRPPLGFDRQIDLGTAWKDLTGLPFVFAVWAARANVSAERAAALNGLLNDARRRGMANAVAIAHRDGPPLGWPADLAEKYFTEHMRYEFTDRCRAGMARFFELACKHGFLDRVRPIADATS